MKNRPTLHRNAKALLQKVLDAPGLDRWIQELPGPEWKGLIRHVGLDDSSELLALSTPEQLVELIDETLWDSGTSDTFDIERFATLLEVLHEAGTRELSEKVASLPEEFLTMAFGRLISVWPTEFLRELAEVDESGTLQKKLESQMFEDIEEYSVLSASGLAWDATLALLTTWCDTEPKLFDRLLGRLSQANMNGIGEPDELVNVLDEMAEFEDDARGEREERRAASGYVSGSDARAFLRLPRAARAGETDAISKAYFRRLRPAPKPAPEAESRLRELLRQHARAEPVPAKRKLTEGSGLLKQALDTLAQSSPERHARALEELAFLTNVLVAAVADTKEQGAAPDPAEAIRSAVASVEAGALDAVGLDPKLAVAKLNAALETDGPIALFRARPR